MRLCEISKKRAMPLFVWSKTEAMSSKKESDPKWAAFVQQLQDGQAKHQKEVDDDYACRIAELD